MLATLSRLTKKIHQIWDVFVYYFSGSLYLQFDRYTVIWLFALIGIDWGCRLIAAIVYSTFFTLALLKSILLTIQDFRMRKLISDVLQAVIAEAFAKFPEKDIKDEQRNHVHGQAVDPEKSGS